MTKADEKKIELPDEILEGEKEGEKEEKQDMVKVGEKEYKQEELSQLVELGELGREAESRYNTKLDKVWPEYTRTQNKNKELLEELNELRKTKEEPEATQPQPGDLTPEQIQESKAAAKKMGIVTDETFTDQLNKNFRKMYLEEREAERLLEKTATHEKEIDGTDGRPKFNQKEILEHMQETGIRDDMKAYKDKYEIELDKWKQEQFLSKKAPGLSTIEKSSAGSKVYHQSPTTEENLDKRVDEALNE